MSISKYLKQLLAKFFNRSRSPSGAASGVVTATHPAVTSPPIPGEPLGRDTQPDATTSQAQACPTTKSLDPRIFTIYPGTSEPSNHDIAVPLQESYNGRYCIPSSLADQSCKNLGIEGLLNQLNDIMGTSFPLSTLGLSDLLKACITRGDDFGIAYARLRRQWNQDFTTLVDRMAASEAEDERTRREALDLTTNEVIDPKLAPRRVWDLLSNRVVPRWWAPLKLEKKKKKDENTTSLDMKSLVVIPVSHAWVAESERSGVHTSINSYQWPVPVPLDSNLECIRIELLNLGLEYSWLDVLCLRQKGDSDMENVRIEEWKLDVPTIGAVYRQTGWDDRVVVYFNGLGRPFKIRNLTDTRHWLNRAWTVQEAGRDMMIGGQTPSSPSLTEQDKNNNPLHTEFYKRLRQAKRLTGISIYTISEAINIMRERAATSELDKIAGLATIVHSERIPIFDQTLSAEDSWAHLIKVMSFVSRAHLLFWFPFAGNERYSWAPSWEQVMSIKVPPAEVGIMDLARIEYQEKTQCFTGYCQVLRNVHILGLGHNAGDNPSICRLGSVAVVDPTTGQPRKFSVQAEHNCMIDENTLYDLVQSQHYSLFVVAVPDDVGHLRKICTLQLVGQSEPWEYAYRPERRNIIFV